MTSKRDDRLLPRQNDPQAYSAVYGSVEPDPQETRGHEEEQNKNKEKPKIVGLFEVLRFATCVDKLLILVGTLGAIGNGSALPAMLVVLGATIDLFVDTSKNDAFFEGIRDFLDAINQTKKDVLDNVTIIYPYCSDLSTYYGGKLTCDDIATEKNLVDEMSTYAIYYCILGVAVIGCAYVQVLAWMTASERQSHRIRSRFLLNVLRQDIGWFDTYEVSELNTRLADDIMKINEGIGDKVGTLIQWLTSSIVAIIVGFTYGWKLALVTMSTTPLLVISTGFFGKLAASMTTNELTAYAKAGAIADEVFSSIRTVVAFGGQEKEAERYKSNLKDAQTFGIRKGFTSGMAMGCLWLVLFSTYALGFWYGGKLIRDEPEDNSIGDTIIVFVSVLVSAFSLGNVIPSLQSLTSARIAAYVIFELIDKKPKIDNLMEGGKQPKEVTGTLSFHNVHFAYPSRPGVKILNGVNLVVCPGQTVALVGASGCGKSTTVQLLQRFYDPMWGQVKLDGEDLRELNVRWLRSHMGVVSQEPVLFAASIRENIRYGREGVSDQDIVKAAKDANAHDFIMTLPENYDTLVGERGAQLSGGQKQRVAIARALVRNPKILLLDEATSALDSESEKVVQDALDKARQGRTTLVIAHRLSTIKSADIIVSFKEGKVYEQGSHSALMARQGIYHQLVMNQTQASSTHEAGEEESDVSTHKGKADGRQPNKTGHKETFSRSTSMTGAAVDTASKKGLEEKKDGEAEEEEEEDMPSAVFTRLMKMNAPEWIFIVFGCISAATNGAVQPAFAVIMSNILGVYDNPDMDEQKDDVRMYSLLLFGLGCLSLFAFFMQFYFFAVSGENLTLRVRDLTFRALLYQDISFFDDERNSTGALTARLATDASLVQGATGSALGSTVMNFSNIGTGVIIAFIYGWQLTLLILGFLPFIILGGFLQMRMMAGVAGGNRAAMEDAAKTAAEAIENIRTVVTLGREGTMHERYMRHLEEPYKQAKQRGHGVGFIYGLAQGCYFFVYAAAFYLGARLIDRKEMDFEDVFLVFGCIVFSAFALGTTNATSRDAGKARVSAQRILKLLDSQASIDSKSPHGITLTDSHSSEVMLRGVQFRYPNRPEAPVLNRVMLRAAPGETVAVVGPSGCGKSTSVQLIERFYDPEAGTVSLGGCDVKELNVQHLRSQLGLVTQEPVLFDRSLADNIAYGDNGRAVSMDEIIAAARAANIHQFITSLPNGYNTLAGEKGAQLSGGQKQRVAIARALVRNPRVLLLDEATSALDTESEKVVQEALDKARKGRTCIVIAHRLSTVVNADRICVLRNGQVAEEGRHSELMDLQGLYYRLQMAQSGPEKQ